MKTFLLTFFLSLSLNASVETPPHIGPEGGRFNKFHIYKVEKLIESRLQDKTLSLSEAQESKDLEMLLLVGKKASQWIEVVNEARETGKLDLSNPTKTGGTPIEKAYAVNTEILKKRYEEFLKKTSPLITDVILSSQELPTDPPVSDLVFVNSLRTLDRIYQATIRWAGATKWLEWYMGRAIFDVRGYIFLKETPNLKEVLDSFSSMTKEDQAKYTGWLLGLCRNGDFDPSDCVDEFNKYAGKKRLYSFYTTFQKYGKSMYDLFFSLKNPRPEVYWSEDKSILLSPFLTPKRNDVRTWLKANVEDEWKSSDFKLNIEYQTAGDIPKIQFKTGVTANVNGLGGNLITMSSDYPIDTIDQKWTIRHEYGHVLGFEDCYLEFYDTREKAMIYYEIDVDNLMCSRNGHIKDIHFEKLKKTYK